MELNLNKHKNSVLSHERHTILIILAIHKSTFQYNTLEDQLRMMSVTTYAPTSCKVVF